MTNKQFDKWLYYVTALDRLQCLASTGKIEWVKALRFAERKLAQLEREMVR